MHEHHLSNEAAILTILCTLYFVQLLVIFARLSCPRQDFESKKEFWIAFIPFYKPICVFLHFAFVTIPKRYKEIE